MTTSKPALLRSCETAWASLIGLLSGLLLVYAELPITSAMRFSAGAWASLETVFQRGGADLGVGGTGPQEGGCGSGDGD